jgi:hypothetical protein
MPFCSLQANNWRVTLKIAAFLSIFAIGMTAPAFAQDAASAASPAQEAPAAQAATAKAGDTVYDAAGAVVGTVESVEGENFVISTGSSKATLPMSALASGDKGPVIGMTKAELEAEIQKAGKAN